VTGPAAGPGLSELSSYGILIRGLHTPHSGFRMVYRVLKHETGGVVDNTFLSYSILYVIIQYSYRRNIRVRSIDTNFTIFHCFFETLFPKTLECSTTFLKRCFSRFLAIPLLFFDLGFRSIDKKQRNASTALIHHTVQNPKKKFKVCEIWKNRSIEKRGMKHCLKKTLFTAVNLKQCFFP
jgi:hypothetical protein